MRAIAVLGVLAFHAGFGVTGGFAGVDVFFVISGYLITRQIVADRRAGTFTFAGFIERRVMRIMPALLVVLAASALLAGILFMPAEFTLFGRSLMLSVLSVSNFGFWLESGYFDVSAQVKPLLHTWSLAVEWQFYLLLPLLFMAFGRRHSAWVIPALLFFCLASAVGGMAWAATDPGASFFLLPPRFWELGAGCLLALSPAIAPRTARQGSAMAFGGLALIAYAFLASSGLQSFPSLGALAAVLGASLVVSGGLIPNAVSALVSLPPLRFVGRISYSLYLVHWPLVVFYQYRSGHKLTVIEALGLSAASLVLAWLLWKHVEQRFRHRTFGQGRRVWLPATGGAGLALLGMGLAILSSGGWPGRLPAEVQRIYAAKADVTPYESCIVKARTAYSAGRPLAAQDVCSLNGETSTQPRFVVWGDSHAAALAPAIAQAAARAGERGFLAAHGGCPPLLAYDTPSTSSVRRESCRAFNEAVIGFVRSQKSELVFLVGRWPREILGVENGREGLFYDPDEPVAVSDRSAQVAAALDETLTQLWAAGAIPVLVMDVPEPGYDVPAALARAALYGRTLNVNPPRARVDGRQMLERRVLVTAAARHNGLIVDPTPAFCNELECAAARDGIPLYADADHLTRSEAENLSPLFATAFRRLEMRKPHVADAELPRGQDYW